MPSGLVLRRELGGGVSWTWQGRVIRTMPELIGFVERELREVDEQHRRWARAVRKCLRAAYDQADRAEIKSLERDDDEEETLDP